MKKIISILGSTGSIGVSTLDLVSRHPGRFEVAGLAAGSNLQVLARQVQTFNPQIVSVKKEDDILSLKKMLPSFSGDILFGEDGAMAVATLSSVDCVISAIVGAAGLMPTLAALRAGKTLGLANKESMVIAGELMGKEQVKSGSVLLPVDSEHSALFQCLQGNRKQDVRKLILTASGGPFLHTPLSEFGMITVERALKHPNWDMGPKITIDSATMMNKGLEVMEARWLFDLPVSQIDVCIHPQSIIHSMVDFCDGSVMAHLGNPDMRVPIAYALSYPERIATGVSPLNLFEKRELTFFEPDVLKFPCLKLAYEVAQNGGTYPAVLNAANEIAVDAFLNKRISFVDIYVLVSKTIHAHQSIPLTELSQVLEADRWAREKAQQLLTTLS